MEGHIYIYGEITSYQGDDAQHYGAVNPRDVMSQMKAAMAEGATELHVHINSPGGDVDAGFAIYDLLKGFTGDVTTIIEGQCYSIATVIMLAGTTRKATENSAFLIHLPSSGEYGNAEDLEKWAAYMRKMEDKMAKLYAAKTTLTVKKAIAEMQKDDFMELATAKELGFITEIIATVKAVAKYNFKTTKMANENTPVKKESVWARFKAAMQALDEGGTTQDPKSVVLKSATGEDYDFHKRTEGQVQEGDEALVNGQTPKDGDVVMANGETFTFAGGKVKAIAEAETEDADEALVAKINKAVTDAVKPLNATITEQQKTINALKEAGEKNNAIFEALKGVSSEIVVEDDPTPPRTGGKKDEKESVLSLKHRQN